MDKSIKNENTILLARLFLYAWFFLFRILKLRVNLYLTPKVGLTEIVKHILIDLRIVVYNYKATILLILL